jgi:autoinducer 2-degrading protein
MMHCKKDAFNKYEVKIMIVKNVVFHVKLEYIKQFINATLENQKNSRLEKGIASFDFFQSKDESTKFLLFEAYKYTAAVDEHLNTEHFKKWISTVEPWFSSPRERNTYVSVDTDIK